MKILYVTSSDFDYLQDQMLIGLRKLYGDHVVDYPRKDLVYQDSDKSQDEMFGLGFTTSKTLPAIEIDRNNIYERVRSGEFELIVFGSVRRQTDTFTKFRLNKLFRLKGVRYIFLDGEDHRRLYKQALPYGTYFKREQRKGLWLPFIRKINFAIPEDKIRHHPATKVKLFTRHVQCEEVYKLNVVMDHCQQSYAFSDEKTYYDDIASSEFGITMKKAGWDCMRHYEIAANGTVPCFYKLHQKPKRCAPHGLIDMKNVVVFDTAEELQRKIEHIRKHDLYDDLQKNAVAWAGYNSCTEVARRLIQSI